MRRFVPLVGLAIGLGAPATAAAQQWKVIGKTRDSTELAVKTASIRRGGDTVTAMVLSRFAVPNRELVKTKAPVKAMAKLATFDCKLEKVIVRETVYYLDVERDRVAERVKPKQPGYGAVFGAYVMVFEELCGKKAK